jgi:hypothetical protein
MGSGQAAADIVGVELTAMPTATSGVVMAPPAVDNTAALDEYNISFVDLDLDGDGAADFAVRTAQYYYGQAPFSGKQLVLHGLPNPPLAEGEPLADNSTGSFLLHFSESIYTRLFLPGEQVSANSHLRGADPTAGAAGFTSVSAGGARFSIALEQDGVNRAEWSFDEPNYVGFLLDGKHFGYFTVEFDGVDSLEFTRATWETRELVPITIDPTLPAPPSTADFDVNGRVAGRDLLLWQRGVAPDGGTAAEYARWEDQFGTAPIATLRASGAVAQAVPETTSLLTALFGASGLLAARRRRTSASEA